MKKLLFLFVSLALLFPNCAIAGFQEHYEAGQAYFAQYQYASAISEFKKALRINYLDNSARIGLVNAYLARGTFFANSDKNYESAANDFRAALFYLKYYPDDTEVQHSAVNIENTTKNLNKCLTEIKFDTSAENRYKKGQQLRLKGLFAEAGYEFAQSVNSPKLSGSAYEQVGDMMKVLGNAEKVAYYYKKSIDVNPNVPDLRLKYARALDKIGKGDLALDEYNNALQNGDNDPETLYSLERIYRQKLLQDENDPVALTNLGAILQKQNKLDEALKYYTLANKIQPDNIQNRLNIASLFYTKKDYERALAAYDSILIVYPDNLTANLSKAECQAALGHTDDAKETFKHVLTLAPNDNKIKSQIMQALQGKMSPNELISFVYSDSKPQKADLDNLYSYAFNLHKQDKFDKAIEGYKTVLKYNPSDSEAFANLAIAYNQNKQFDLAQSTIKLAKEKFPADKQVTDVYNSIISENNGRVISKAMEYYNAKDYENALNTYLSVNPQTFDSLVGAASCYNAMSDAQKAIEYYKKALTKNKNSEIAYYIGALYIDLNDLPNAKVYLNMALSFNSANQNAKDLLSYINEQENSNLLNNGIAFYEQNNYTEALKIFNQIIASNPKSAYALYYRASIYDSQKKYAQAISDYKQAVANSSDLDIANYLIAIDYDALGQYKNALTYYKKYVAITKDSNEYKTYSEQRINALKKYE